MLVCHCNRITDSAIRSAIREASGDVSEALAVLDYLPLCNGCTEAINWVIDDCKNDTIDDESTQILV